MKLLIFTLIILLLPLRVASSQDRLGDFHICEMPENSELYGVGKQLKSENDEKVFSSMLAIRFAYNDPIIVDMISALNFNSAPRKFSIKLEYFPINVLEIKNNHETRYRNIQQLLREFRYHTIEEAAHHSVVTSPKPHHQVYVFENSTRDDSLSVTHKVIAECRLSSIAKLSKCRRTEFIEEEIRLTIDFPYADYMNGKKIFKYLESYLKQEIISLHPCKDDN